MRPGGAAVTPWVINYARNQRDADATVEEILGANGTALAVRAGVADELDVERLFTETTEAFGGVDVVVHAARQMTLGPVADYDLDTFDGLQRTNVRGTFVVNPAGLASAPRWGRDRQLLEHRCRPRVPDPCRLRRQQGRGGGHHTGARPGARWTSITVNAVAPGLEPPGAPADIANLSHSGSARTATRSPARRSTDGTPSSSRAWIVVWLSADVFS